MRVGALSSFENAQSGRAAIGAMLLRCRRSSNQATEDGRSDNSLGVHLDNCPEDVRVGEESVLTGARPDYITIYCTLPVLCRRVLEAALVIQ